MSRLLSELLAAEEPLFTMALKQLERASGNSSVDVRLTAEIVGKVHMKCRALGLDPADTTGPELYRALFNLIKQHDAFLAARIGLDEPSNSEKALTRIKETVDALSVPKKAWVMKHSVAKRLLQAMPPKQVMKVLGYRSIDSMVKRESIDELFAGIRFVESESWQSKFVTKYSSLKPADFETRDIQVINLEPKKWGEATVDFVHGNRHNITHLKELGAVIILPLPATQLPGITITVLPLILHYINEIRLYSSFFKSQQVKTGFGHIVANTLITDPGKHATVAGQDFHWRIIHRHFGSSEERLHTDIFEPHVEPADLIWRQTEETLYRLEPALHFWYDTEFVGVEFDGRPVSFNLMDMAVNYLNNIAYGKQSVSRMRDSLWNEIYLRYLGEKAVETQVLGQLNADVVGTDSIAVALEGV